MIKPNLDCNNIFSIDFGSNGIPFGFKRNQTEISFGTTEIRFGRAVFGTKPNSFWCQINRKSEITIQIGFDLTRFKKIILCVMLRKKVSTGHDNYVTLTRGNTVIFLQSIIRDFNVKFKHVLFVECNLFQHIQYIYVHIYMSCIYIYIDPCIYASKQKRCYSVRLTIIAIMNTCNNNKYYCT